MSLAVKRVVYAFILLFLFLPVLKNRVPFFGVLLEGCRTILGTPKKGDRNVENYTPRVKDFRKKHRKGSPESRPRRVELPQASEDSPKKSARISRENFYEGGFARVFLYRDLRGFFG